MGGSVLFPLYIMLTFIHIGIHVFNINEDLSVENCQQVGYSECDKTIFMSVKSQQNAYVQLCSANSLKY